jgi:hypothetical protein
MCHNDKKLTNPLDNANIVRTAHSIYSPDVNPCDFWLLGIGKHRMTDKQLQSLNEILDVVTELSDGVTFEELQYCFLAWMERFQ